VSAVALVSPSCSRRGGPSAQGALRLIGVDEGYGILARELADQHGGDGGAANRIEYKAAGNKTKAHWSWTASSAALVK